MEANELENNSKRQVSIPSQRLPPYRQLEDTADFSSLPTEAAGKALLHAATPLQQVCLPPRLDGPANCVYSFATHLAHADAP